MMRKLIPISTLVFLLGSEAAFAQNSAEKSLALDGQIAADGHSVTLNWFTAEPPRTGSATVKRRIYGQVGGEHWQTIGPALGPVMRFIDKTIEPGVAYEYQVTRTTRDILDVGYWLTGVELPAQAQRGKAYVLVDETLAEDLAPRLERLVHDLTADGWQVLRKRVPRGNDRAPLNNLKIALATKQWLNTHYLEDPSGQHALVLVGHVPIIKTGQAAPDGHTPEPHASDLFYADMNGRWTATPEGQLLDNLVPGNFIEMQVGRIDFSPVSGGKREQELQLLNAYFDKNHHWRSGMLGDLREAYGQSEYLEVERAGLRNIVGPRAVTIGGHHDAGETKPWLWGVDFGDWNGSVYAEKYANKAVFAINFGSGKQKIGSYFNPMTALLAQQWYPLAVGWGARPAWRLHHMALGGSIGQAHLRTVNNGLAEQPYRASMDYFPTGVYLFRNSVWVNLLGDPTLRAFPLAPPQKLLTQASAQTLKLTWTASPDPDTLGYRVFRAPAAHHNFTPLDGGKLITKLEFTDTAPEQNAQYMVRAYGLKQVYAGSFYTFSQGVFAASNAAAKTDLAQDMSISTRTGAAIRLPDAFNSVKNGKIYAVIEGPARGTLRFDGGNWIYTPPQGFSGTTALRFSISDDLRTDEAVLTIKVGS
jgi:hypothetical protein